MNERNEFGLTPWHALLGLLGLLLSFGLVVLSYLGMVYWDELPQWVKIPINAFVNYLLLPFSALAFLFSGGPFRWFAGSEGGGGDKAFWAVGAHIIDDNVR